MSRPRSSDLEQQEALNKVSCKQLGSSFAFFKPNPNFTETKPRETASFNNALEKLGTLGQHIKNNQNVISPGVVPRR